MNYLYCLFFFFNDTATTEIYTLSLHDALPIFTPAIPATLDIATMSPPPARTMRGKSACVSAIGASRSTSIIRWYTSNTVSIARERCDIPALLNKPLIGPPWLTAHSHALSTREGMFSKSVASKGRTNAPGLQRSAIAVRADKFRPDRITLTPAWAEASANAAPIPEVAPVIHHILPSDIFIPPYEPTSVASDMASRQRHICFTPNHRHQWSPDQCPFCANNGHRKSDLAGLAQCS